MIWLLPTISERLSAEVGIDAVAYSESLDRRSWQHMKLFLDELS